MINFSLQEFGKEGDKSAPPSTSHYSPKLQALSDANRRKLENAEMVYAKYQENILKSDGLQCEINRGLKAGESVYNLFLKAVQAISLMTNNPVFYDVAKKDLLAIYGIGLGEPQVLQFELSDTETRLDKLKQAAEREQDEDTLSRIRTAIRYHEQTIEQLKSKITKSEQALCINDNGKDFEYGK